MKWPYSTEETWSVPVRKVNLNIHPRTQDQATQTKLQNYQAEY